MSIHARLTLILLLTGFLPGTLPAGASTAIPEMNSDKAAAILLSVDQAFSDRATESDIPTAFLEYAADDAVMYRNGMEPVTGKKAIAALLSGEAGARLVWKPLAADIAASGDLGYTRGSFTYHTAAGEDGSPPKGPYQGYYVSIWKRQADGSWKWVFDSGVTSKLP